MHVDHCEDTHGDSDCDDTDHFNTDGLSLESHGAEIYSQFQGSIAGSVEVHMNEAEDFSIHFLDSSGEEIEVTDADCYPLSFNVTDGDGDLGLDPNDILHPFCQTCDHYYNLKCEYDELRENLRKLVPLI